MEKMQHSMDTKPGTAHGGSRSQGLSTLGLGQLFVHIIETMQHRKISELEDQICCFRKRVVDFQKLLLSQGNPGLPETPPARDLKMMLDHPHSCITNAVLVCMSGGVNLTMPKTWEAIWQMFPEDTDGILARVRENIHSEAIKPYHIQSLKTYLGMLIISSAVIPITWDFDHPTLDFLGDDYIQQCVAHLHKSIIDHSSTKRE